jgi:hypothetical protein
MRTAKAIIAREIHIAFCEKECRKVQIDELSEIKGTQGS